ncbi:Sgo0707 family adhesin [Streptococcus sanguinis]|uniref:Sgo0707 family adhesin n=1 Tax=Streptococcus sanguinis TaxID=1305 RepID=UPI0022849AC7|nr:Sgo0707 family adhesin [Streptococcus sanguinis]MCY7028770.1 SHIRT domain-containing protein [Streptococcus sanguinis]
MKYLMKKYVKSFLFGLTFIFVLFSSAVYAVTELTESTNLSTLDIYQFTLTQDNMEVLSQGASVERDFIPANGNWKESTVFSLRVDKNQTQQTFNSPIQLRFNNAGIVNGKAVDVYVTFHSIDTYLVQRNADYQDPNKTLVPFLTVDENWGSKSIQIMDYIWPPHPTLTHDMHGSFALDTDVTAELRYQDGTPTDLKMVMLPSDIDVVYNALGRAENFSIYDKDIALNKIVKNTSYALNETLVGNKTTWHPTRSTQGDSDEHNVSGFAVRSETNAVRFEFTTTAGSGGLFGFYTEAPKAPVKQASKDKLPALAGESLNYTAKFTMPTPGKGVIGSLSSMQMIETLDNRLDFQSLTLQLDGRTLTQGADYTLARDGQKVTVAINAKHLTSSNAGKEYTIIYKTKTNDNILQNRAPIENRVTQEIDNIPVSSEIVTTNVLYKKSYQFESGTQDKSLPQEVLNLLPQDQLDLENGSAVTPDSPKGNKRLVSTSEGNWVFQNYDKESDTIQNQDVLFTGIWNFQEYEKPKKEVFNKNNENIDNQEVKANDVLTYKITYKNTSDRELDVTITDELPKHTDYVNGSTVYDDFAQNRLTWRRRMAPEETVEVSFKVRVNQDVDGHILQSSAQVSTDMFTLETNRTSNPTAIKKYVLPETGGNGTILYLWGGSVITLGSALWLIVRNERYRKFQ